MRARIESSQITKDGNVRVDWNNGDYFVYDFDLNLLGWQVYNPGSQWNVMEVVSRTSAHCTMNGTGEPATLS